MRVKAIISYNGSAFYGSQKQPNKNTIQGEFENSLKKLQIDSNTIFSGRTDKNVHALNQVVSFDIPNFWSDLERLKNSLNKIINKNIKIKSIQKVNNNFNPRFDAKKRVYRYIISTKELTPFNSDFFIYEKYLDIKKINIAMSYFVGEFDFKYFSKSGSDTKTTICKIYKAFAYRYKDYYIFYFLSNRFLRSQIRIMVNFLINISKGKLSLTQLVEQLQCKKLHFNKPVAPQGLYLGKIIFV